MERIKFGELSDEYVRNLRKPATRESIGLYIVIGALTIAIVFVVILMFVVKNKTTVNPAEIIENFPKNSLNLEQCDYLETIKELKENERGFLKEISQMVLLNFLLPIITGVTGFLFGAKGKIE